MNANLYYDCNGESWTILDFHSSITFSSERGLKQAINRKINRDLGSGNLRRHFGTGSTCIVKSLDLQKSHLQLPM